MLLADWRAPLIAAPFVGSLLGVLIRRVPEGRPVALARSCCESCGAVLGVRDLLPLLSYVALRGRCRACRSRIPAFHPAVELAALLVAGITIAAEAARLPGPLWPAGLWPARLWAARLWADCALGWTLLALAWIDWKHWRLPDVLTLPLLVAGLGVTAVLQPQETADHAAAAALAYLAFRALAAGYRALRGRDGLGQGDAKLLAAGGAWVGLQALPLVVLAAAVAGLVLALVLRLRGGDMRGSTALPFGPCLALAIWGVRLLGG